jgi:glycerophosphoryl diester phosphodiesterase
VDIIAHRGASYDAPENTLAAFRLGLEQRADALELDVHLSRDGAIVVIHDFTTRRTAGLDRPVQDQSLAELKSLDAGRWKAPRWAGEKIPALHEVLAILPEGKRLFIEIKCGAEILPEMERILKADAERLKNLALIGFSYETMKEAKARIPTVEVCWLSAFKPDPATGRKPTADELLQKAVAAGLDGLDLLHTGPLDAPSMEKARDLKQKVYVWTVDKASQARRMAALGVAGITTNRPGWMRREMENFKIQNPNFRKASLKL